MIPKIIHYCWFGRGPKPKLALKCIGSWKKRCPDYQIIEWNEDNYDVASAPLFVRQAVEEKKWAFATDYIRYDVVYRHGGVYMDTDVELLKPLDPLLENTAYFGFETSWGRVKVASGLGFGAEKGTPFLLELMRLYQDSPLLLPDGTVNAVPNTLKEAEIFLSHGLRPDGTDQVLAGGIHIYPKAVFCPLEYATGKLIKTAETVSIHWYGYSWGTKEQKEKYKRFQRAYRLHAPHRLLAKLIGQERYEKLKKRFGKSAR